MSTPIEPAILPWLSTIVNNLAPGFFGIVGVIAGGYLSHKRMVSQFAADSESEQRNRRRERLEELFMEIDRWQKHNVSHYNRFKLVMTGKITYQAALDRSLTTNNETDVQRLYMIAEIYFHDAHDQLVKIVSIENTLASIKREFKMKYECDEMPSEFHAEQTEEALIELVQSCSDYLSALATRARELD